MYNAFRQFCERLLRIPPEPGPPPGDEASARIFRAAPNYYRYLLVIWAVVTGAAGLFALGLVIGPLVAVSIALAAQGQSWTLLLLVGPGLLLTVLMLERLFRLAILRLDYEKRWYVVTDRSLRIREGVVSVREMTVTFANIQNISISQGPIQRLLRIADLQVDTAGGGGAANAGHASRSLHTAWFRGIDNANEVRELIQQRVRHLKDSGLGDHEELAAPAAAAASAAFLAALREVHAEACALRQAVSGRA